MRLRCGARRVGVAALVLAIIPLAIWSCVLLWAWFRMSHLPPKYEFVPSVAHLYAYQVLFTLWGFVVLLAAVSFSRRLSIVSSAVLGACLGSIGYGLWLVVEALYAGSDFYHFTFGHGVFDQCTGVYGNYSALSAILFFAVGVGFAIVPSLAHFASWLTSLTSRPSEPGAAGATGVKQLDR